VELWLAEQWDTERTWGHLPGRGLDVLSALAIDAEHPGGPVIVVPAPRLAVIAAYIRPDGAAEPHLAVNPVLLAALEPAANELAMTTAMDRWSNPSDPSGPASGARGARQAVAGPTPMATGGNPYSFYGSFEECAAAQRARCDACLPGSSCTPITNASRWQHGVHDARGQLRARLLPALHQPRAGDHLGRSLQRVRVGVATRLREGRPYEPAGGFDEHEIEAHELVAVGCADTAKDRTGRAIRRLGGRWLAPRIKPVAGPLSVDFFAERGSSCGTHGFRR